jgi:outer membrane protein assembly factor BamB
MTRRALALAAVALTLGGCGLFDEAEVALPGDRVAVRVAAPTPTLPAERAAQIAALGPAQALAEWPQPNARADRAPGHIAGPAGLRSAWRADVGAGSGDASRITAAPVVAGGLVYTLDAESDVVATDAASGRRIWSASAAPEGQRGREGFGGGLAVADGRLFVTTGFGEVVAMGVGDGAVLWRQPLGAPLRSGPAVDAGRVVVVTRDNAGFALDAATGGVLWRVLGARAGAGFLGGASPAVSGELAVLPFTSGEILAVSASNGRRLWSDLLTGGRGGGAGVDIADVSGDPIIAGAAVFASNYGGQMVAVDGRNGARGWLRPFGGASPAWAAGSTLFLATTDGRLMRLAAATGETVWSVDLPRYEDPEDREGLIHYKGPVVADGAVYLSSSDEGVLIFDAQTGAARGSVEISGGAATAPVIAGGTLYVLSQDATLHAFR